MSLIPPGTTVIQALLNNLLPLVFLRPRSIGGIVANCTIEERAADRLTITRHPVENGAAITDHAYQEPAQLTITAGWSNASFQALGNPNYVISIYDELLELQRAREPFDIITGKRFYQNMLMSVIYQTTDEKSENALLTVMEFTEILLVSAQSVVVPPAKNMKDPQSNAAPVNTGSQSLKPGTNFNFNVPEDL